MSESGQRPVIPRKKLSTDSERRNRAEPKVYELLLMLRRGGSLVCACECTSEELAAATKSGLTSHDSDGFVYVYRKPAFGP